jgi:HSP20 family protein
MPENKTTTATAEPETQTGLSRRESWLPSLGIADPFAMMRSLTDEMDRLFENVLGWGGLSRWRQPLLPSPVRETGRAGLWYPQIEVREKDGKLLVRADLPGLKKEEVHVELKDNALTIEGERRQESEQKQEGFFRSERNYGRFYRSIPLPEGVNPDQVQAGFKDGVLEVTIPVPEHHARGHKIDIR